MIAKQCHLIAFLPLPFLLLFAALTLIEVLFVVPWMISMAAQLFFLFFFRDRPRHIGEGIISPADGRVLAVKGNTVFIFMSLFDQHVNLMPCDGRIVSMIHHPGKHAPAFGDTSSNERMAIEIESVMGSLHLEQVAGVMARRIVPYVKEGDILKKGERIGIIRFGSRVELTVPKECVIKVKEHQKVRAGDTLASCPHE